MDQDESMDRIYIDGWMTHLDKQMDGVIGNCDPRDITLEEVETQNHGC
jgi:hypothetical protein